MKALAEEIAELDSDEIYGRVVGVLGLMFEVVGPIQAMPVGARVVIETGARTNIPCEAVGFSGANALLMPFAALEGVRRGCRAIVTSALAAVRPSSRWVGRVVKPWGSRSIGWGRCQPGILPMHSAILRRRRMLGSGSGHRSISGYGRSIPSLPAAAANEWASSPARASVNRF